MTSWGKHCQTGMAGALAGICLSAASPAAAVVIELKDVAADRIERQLAWVRGQVPLPGTPDVANLDGRLAAKGLVKGSPVFLRIFKDESVLELWMRKDDGFVLLDSYPICQWTGALGPKMREGDKQSPEGFYTVTARQTRHRGRWRKALDLGFPNLLDQRLGRTGSYILLHGGCSSTGCFAMTDPVMDEIHGLAQAALRGGQDRVHVHIFPFRLTAAKLAEHRQHPWSDTWDELKAGYDSFDRTRIPPRVAVCEQRYVVEDGHLGDATTTRPHKRSAKTSSCAPRVVQRARQAASKPNRTH